jgi:type IX secretion system PorP/SprF family membrane protein
MKRSIIFILVFSSVAISAQQLNTSSLYELQSILHDPSVAGLQKHGTIGGSFKTQWDGMPGGPQTGLVFGSTFLEKAKLGLGGYLYSDVTGPTKRIGVEMAYAYQVPMRNNSTFSVGLELRAQQFSYDKSKLQASLGNDPVIAGDDKKIKGDAGLGASFTNDKFQIGVSVSQLIQSKLNFYSGSQSTTDEAMLYRHYYLHSYYIWRPDDQVTITPNVLFIYLPNAPLEFQAGARVEHKNIFWWGLSHRLKQSWMLSAGLRIKQNFMIGYSFDIYTTPLSVFDKGGNGHELLLKYDFAKKK